MKKTLLILNGPAYGSDETFNAVRLAVALAKRGDVDATVLLTGDAVTCAVAGQEPPTVTPSWTGCSRGSPGTVVLTF